MSYDPDLSFRSGLPALDPRFDADLGRWIAAETERVGYRPAWSVEVHRHEVPVLRVSARVLDARHDVVPGERVIIHQHPVPVDVLTRVYDELHAGDPAHARKRWFRWLFDILGYVDDHERAEWFRIDGVIVVDPHGEAGYTGERWAHVEIPAAS